MLPPPLAGGVFSALTPAAKPLSISKSVRFDAPHSIRYRGRERISARAVGREPGGGSQKKGLPPEGSSPEKKGRNPKRPDQPCGTSSCWPSGSPSQPDEPEDTASALRIRFARSTTPFESGEETSSVTEAKASATFISPERRFFT